MVPASSLDADKPRDYSKEIRVLVARLAERLDMNRRLKEDSGEVRDDKARKSN